MATVAEKLDPKQLDLIQAQLSKGNKLEEVRLMLRKRAQQDLWFFNYHCCGWKDISTPLHLQMCETWQNRQWCKFIIDLIPRSHLKTSLWTVGGTLHELVQDEVILPGGVKKRGCDLRFLIINAKLDNAVDILADIKSIVTSNEMFKWLFPEYVPDLTWTNGRGKGKWTTSRIDFPCSAQAGRKEGNIEVMSVGANLTSKHYDVMVFDDPINEDNTTNKEYRDKIHKWYKNSLQLRDNPGSSRVRIIGTRWHYDDLYGRLITREAKRRETLDDDGNPLEPIYLIYRRKAVENGIPIWQERFTLEELKRLKEEELGSYIYSCQYDNEPVPEEDAHFKIDKIQPIDSIGIPEDCVNFAAVDMADEDSTRGDWTVISVGGIDTEENLYMRDITRGKFSTQETLDIIYQKTQQYNLRRVAIEIQGFQKSIVRNYKREADERGWYIPWVEMERGRSSRFRRALGLQPRIENGRFFYQDDMENADWMIEELTTFPKGVHDDILDTIIDIDNIARVSPKTVEKPKRSDQLTYADAFGDIDDWAEPNEIRDPFAVSYLN